MLMGDVFGLAQENILAHQEEMGEVRVLEAGLRHMDLTQEAIGYHYAILQ